MRAGGGAEGGGGQGPLGRHRNAEVRDEIRFHLEERVRELEAAGVPPEEAVRQARAAFGDPDRVAEKVLATHRRHDRGEGRRRMLDGWAREAVVSARGLLRKPLFTVVVVATLALGIGPVTAVFSVVNASLLRALPFPAAERLVFLQGAYDAPEGPQVRGASPPEARDWGEMSRSFEAAAAFATAPYTLTGGEGDAERVSVETVAEGYLGIVGATPLLGRPFSAADHLPGSGEAVALVSEDLWTRRWGRDPALVGRTVRLDGAPFTVVGVLPRPFAGLGLATEMWVPLGSVLGEAAWLDRGDRWLGAVARLRPGTDVEAAQRDMDGVAARLEESHPEANLDRIALVTPLRDVYLGSTRTLMLVLFGATGFLLVIAAANVANLLLVRSWARRGDMAVRRALGAGRVDLARQAFTESLLLAAAGTVGGLILGVWGSRLLAAAMPDALLPAYVDVRPDAAVLLLAAAAMALVGVTSGIAPALTGGRARVAGRLRERSAGGGPGGQGRLQRALVAGEVALAIVLLVGAGLMVRSLESQLAVRPGFQPERLLAARLILPGEHYPDDGARRAVMDELTTRLAAEPGVASVTFGSDAPLRDGSSAAYLWTEEGGAVEDRVRFYFHRVLPGWFETMGVAMVGGRAFEAADGTGGLAVAVISRAMAERSFGSLDPVGRSLVVGRPDGQRLTVVGVADDVRWRDLTTDLVSGPTDPDVYVPWPALTSFRVEVMLRTRGEPAAVQEAVRRAVRAVDPELVPFDVAPMTEVLRTQTAQGRFGSLVLGAFSALAAVLAAVGLYGVLAFTVGRRTREIAVRMALGADGGAVRRMVLRDGMVMAALGVALGLAVATVAGRSLGALLFGVRPIDPLTFAAVAALMLGVAALAAWVPAWRATRVDPQRALAGE